MDGILPWPNASDLLGTDSEMSPGHNQTLTHDKNRPSPRIKKAAAVRFMYFSAEDGQGWMDVLAPPE